MVVVVGTGFAGSDFVVRMDAEARIEVDTNFCIDWVGALQANIMLVSVQPEQVPHFSLSRCQQYFISRVSMLYNIFLHVLLTYKIYKRYLP